MTDWNTNIIEEFRANNGVVGGMFEGTPILILHTTGAKSGLERLAPLMYQDGDGGYLIFASKRGAHTHPDWYHNLVADPAASVEVGNDKVDVTASVLGDKERQPIWSALKQNYPTFQEYENATDRQIPVILLTPNG